MATTSRLSGLRNLSIADRRTAVTDAIGGQPELLTALDPTSDEALTMAQADRMVENVIGQIGIPVGVCTNLVLNGREVLVPMATEEPSVVAAASNIARMSRTLGGVTATSSEPVMQAQVQLLDVADPQGARARILERKDDVLALANAQDPKLVEVGGGARDLIVRTVHGLLDDHLIVHLVVNVGDAMGANAVNTMAEAIAPLLAEIAQGRSLLRILTNLADMRITRARIAIAPDQIGGPQVIDDMIAGAALAYDDPYRAATHNKGIMNGISAVVLATGNDTRAVEAGAHAYAARDGQYRALSRFEKDSAGNLVATLELPMAVGLVGGATKSHPTARAGVAMTEVTTARELGEIICAIGLAQNVAAVRALAAEGIQRGHMGLHARNIAVAAGATGTEVDDVAAELVARRAVRVDVAETVLAELRAR
ncbi:hydroxymethylglutaryl-CoA reductase, degradative [Microbacterium esteraromaticum]|uniref:3-hydroxy-3-methylglutaryl coenzyme A reductase n=1 Tax=Microbacterium esteraromaticum TaxID=57043 RepID=A0A939DU41_9MICO|nr:hydroxymethylglutaryl-CoA reductase, degradative [Microbacterium esteraromaticum]MBN8204945.1 hydroxymethylglutaryl-CoA reductase, degradative [Microbacterium esteraromaticum]MBN8415099.1 hydroxymethylglutaryl-CoA reductase, degradative [Microbacterium esteraromaticum]MBY6059907.1 hydroxymethylglutaryl-CoA reductase, degradative [Microbacterium esteraromaticum]WDH79092.1 hydroxymethylglutaryl-CoA reductase, degradative [Microbacterium esteraromaticum]